MSTVLRGYERSEGQFVNKETGEMVAYDNYMLFFTSDEKEDVTGLFCGAMKSKAGSFKVHGVDSIDDAIGKQVFFLVDPTVKSKKSDVPVCQGLIVIGGTTS